MFAKYAICIPPLLQLMPKINTPSQLATLPLLDRLCWGLVPYHSIFILGSIGHIAFASYGITQKLRFDQESPWASSLLFQAIFFGLLLQPALTTPEARKWQHLLWLLFATISLLSSIVILIVGFQLQQTLFMYSYLIVGLVSTAGVFRELQRRRLLCKQALNGGSGRGIRRYATILDPMLGSCTTVSTRMGLDGYLVRESECTLEIRSY